MEKVTITFTSNAKLFRAAIDGVRLRFQGGKVERHLAAGFHALTWNVLGSPGEVGIEPAARERQPFP